MRKKQGKSQLYRAEGGQGAKFPCGGEITPNCFSCAQLKEKSQQGTGNEASLPVTSRTRRLVRPTLLPQTPKRRNTAYTAAFRRFLSIRIIPSQSKYMSCHPPLCIRGCCWRGEFSGSRRYVRLSPTSSEVTFISRKIGVPSSLVLWEQKAAQFSSASS